MTPDDHAQRSWTVLVRAGRIVGRYRSAEGQAAACDAARLGDDIPVEAFTVEDGRTPPPDIGTAVDPAALGWTSIGRLSCR